MYIHTLACLSSVAFYLIKYVYYLKLANLYTVYTCSLFYINSLRKAKKYHFKVVFIYVFMYIGIYSTARSYFEEQQYSIFFLLN